MSTEHQLPEPLRYTISIPFDKRLYKHDLIGSKAHAQMLAQQQIISETDCEAICDGLDSIQQEIEQGVFQFRDDLEDIHMNIEWRLTEIIGDIGAKLHTARSRNDQVALDMRLFVRDATKDAIKGIRKLQAGLLSQAESNIESVMPGYTHLQRAQPVLVAHHMLAYFEMVQRDIERFDDCNKRTNVLPLGSGALAGVTYPINREATAHTLGFHNVSRNSIDSVSDRDFVVEFQSAASLTMMHLSRLAEEIVIWASEEFGFITLDQDYTTGSSIMPQKRNPDVAELGRGKTGRVYGNLISILTTLKSLPLAYNKDLQEDKEALFDTVDTLNASLGVFAGMVGTMQIKQKETRAAAEAGVYSGILATDLADYLVGKGLPFRKAHSAVKKLVEYANAQNKPLNELYLDEYKEFSHLFSKEIFTITVDSSVAARNSKGGTSPKQVRFELDRAKEMMKINCNEND